MLAEQPSIGDVYGMTKTLRDFIASRETDIKEQIKALHDELRELRAAKSAIDSEVAQPAKKPASERKTHRDMIVSALDARSEGGTSDRVIEWVKADFDVEISQASMSSQLSRAKSDGAVSLDISTKTWRSKKHSEERDEPTLTAPQHENSEPAGSEEAKTEDASNTSGFHNPNFDRTGQ